MSKRPKTTTSATEAKSTATAAAPAKKPPSREKTPAGHRTDRSPASSGSEKVAARGSGRKPNGASSVGTTPAAAPRKPRGGGLTAAAALLTKTGKSMKCGELAEALITSGAWKPSGKTPAATLASAIFREIKDKGGAARLKKIAPGTFAAK